MFLHLGKCKIGDALLVCTDDDGDSQKMPDQFPFWSCCLEPWQIDSVSKSGANEAHVKWLAKSERRKLPHNRPTSRQKLDRTRALLNSIQVDGSEDEDD